MAVLDIKLLRDLRRQWAQGLAIALVIAGGVASLVMAVGSFRSLEETRTAYYERYRFADVFADVRRAPKTLVAPIAEIPGVGAVDARIEKLALLDIPEMREPATGLFVSLPAAGEPMLNQPYMRLGRMPDPDSAQEVLVNEGFAKAHAFVPGSRFSAILNGRKRELVIVGVALSPEFVYAIGPGDRVPDDRRFAIVWMPEKALASAYNLDGAFSSVTLKLLRGASEREVIKRLDDLLDPYGGSAAYGRKDQTSDAWLSHGFDMLRSMNTLPAIFLMVTAFLLNLMLSRLVALEREQIGLFKAIGYRNGAIAAHYVKFVLVITLVGIAIGSLAGTWLGIFLTRLFGDYYQFPFLVFAENADVYLLAALLSLAAAMAGAFRAVREAVRLSPAVAMQPPAPQRFRHLLPGWFEIDRVLSQPTMMLLRGLSRHPVRVGLTMLGIVFATGMVIVSQFVGDSVEQMININYFLSNRQDASLAFIEKRPLDVATEVARLPGVLVAEPYRGVPVRIRKGSIERRVMISGRPRDADLTRIIDTDLRPVALPDSGLAISALLGKILGAGVGGVVELDLLEGQRRTVAVPVSALIEDYFGLQATMDAEALARLMREAPAANGVNVTLDGSKLTDLYAAIKAMPTAAGIALRQIAVTNFREMLGITLTTMSAIYTGLAAIIAFGVVYNTARISLSERARELASLRVLGFTRGETIRILLLELGLITVMAQLPGWAFGYGLAWLMKTQLSTELMRVPIVVQNQTFVLSSAMVLVATLLSALVVARRVSGLDLVAVLKTRE